MCLARQLADLGSAWPWAAAGQALGTAQRAPRCSARGTGAEPKGPARPGPCVGSLVLDGRPTVQCLQEGTGDPAPHAVTSDTGSPHPGTEHSRPQGFPPTPCHHLTPPECSGGHVAQQPDASVQLPSSLLPAAAEPVLQTPCSELLGCGEGPLEATKSHMGTHTTGCHGDSAKYSPWRPRDTPWSEHPCPHHFPCGETEALSGDVNCLSSCSWPEALCHPTLCCFWGTCWSVISKSLSSWGQRSFPSQQDLGGADHTRPCMTTCDHT